MKFQLESRNVCISSLNTKHKEKNCIKIASPSKTLLENKTLCSYALYSLFDLSLIDCCSIPVQSWKCVLS